MSARRVGLLLLLLGFGGAVEGVWNIRNHVDIGAMGCHVLGSRFDGPSFSFEETKALEAPASLRVEIANGFGAVSVLEGRPGSVDVTLRKVVFLRSEDKAREFARRIVLETALEGSTLRVGTNRASLERSDGTTGFETHFEVKVDHGGVHAKDLQGGAKVEVLGDDVVLEGFRGPVEVEVQRGSVELTPAGPLTGSVSATAANGVRLEVPAGSSFELLATSSRGEVQAELPGLSFKEKSPSRLAATLGGGELRVTLSADHGDVVLTPRKDVAER